MSRIKGIHSIRSAGEILKNNFYETDQWKSLRYKALVRSKGKCEACGVDGHNSELHVDHIKPRSKHPELALELSNLQVLCADCNAGKSNKDETDWRQKTTTRQRQLSVPEQKAWLEREHGIRFGENKPPPRETDFEKAGAA